MKRIASLFLVVCLLFSTAALAAPTRELTDRAQASEELIAQVQPLCNVVAAAAFRQHHLPLEVEAAPGSNLVLGMVLEALASHLVVKEAVEGKISLTVQDVQNTARQLLYNKDMPDLTVSDNPYITLSEEQAVFDLAGAWDYIGTHIYDVHLTEEELILKADIYTTGGIAASAVEAPEESLVWLGHIIMRLKPEAEAPAGFTLDSFTAPELYYPASWVPFVSGKRFELLYPNFMTEQEPQGKVLFQAFAGDAVNNLSVREEEGSLDSLLEAWQKADEAAQNGAVSKLEGGLLYTKGQGIFRIAYPDPQGDREVCLVLELNYLPELEHEFTLYQTFLNNSFVVYSHSHG